jgi:ABC-2 type transport system ATP-binding protein
VHEPEVLILDEPTNGLDPNQIRQARSFIRSLAGRHTILLSTHILAEVEQTCDRVIILDEGRIKAVDTPGNLTRNLRMAGMIRVEIQCPGPAAAAAELARSEGIRSVAEPELLEDGWHALVLRSESGSGPRAEIVARAAAHGWTLREIHRPPPRLEDVFLELTQPARR